MGSLHDPLTNVVVEITVLVPIVEDEINEVLDPMFLQSEHSIY